MPVIGGSQCQRAAPSLTKRVSSHAPRRTSTGIVLDVVILCSQTIAYPTQSLQPQPASRV
eukprot:11794999-Prorocentrum_lima.AAC.1